MTKITERPILPRKGVTLFKTGLPRQRRQVRIFQSYWFTGFGLLHWLFDPASVPKPFRQSVVGYERDCPRGREGYRLTRARLRRIGRDCRRLKAAKARDKQLWHQPDPHLLARPAVAFVPDFALWRIKHQAAEFMKRLRLQVQEAAGFVPFGDPAAVTNVGATKVVAFSSGEDGTCTVHELDRAEVDAILARHGGAA